MGSSLYQQQRGRVGKVQICRGLGRGEVTAVVAHIFHGLWPSMAGGGVGGGGEGAVRQKRLIHPPFGRIHC